METRFLDCAVRVKVISITYHLHRRSSPYSVQSVWFASKRDGPSSRSLRSTCDLPQLRNSRVPTSKAIINLRTVLAGRPYASMCGSCRTRSGDFDLLSLLANSGWAPRVDYAGLSFDLHSPPPLCVFLFFARAHFGRGLHLRQIEPFALGTLAH